MKEKETLDRIRVGDKREISDVLAVGAMRRRLFDLGFTSGAAVSCVGASPLGDPLMLAVRGKVVAVRKKDLKGIYINSDFRA